jgi:hypothetical protein
MNSVNGGLVAIKKCGSCRKSNVVYNLETKSYGDFCGDCGCVQFNCTARATHDNNLCDAHFAQTDNLCQLCLEPCQKGLYCYKCYKVVPKCESVGCNLRVISNKDSNEYFKHCQRCKCSTFSCNNPRSENSDCCDTCNANRKCIDCGNRKSLNHNNPRCSKCEAKQKKCLKCNGKTGYFFDQGYFKAYPYCKKCACKTAVCFQMGEESGFCRECDKKKKCECGKPIPSNCSFCTKCEQALLLHKVKCPTQGCRNYMLERHSMCSVCKSKGV